MLLVCSVMVLKLTLLTLYISIIRHRVATETYTLTQSLFHGFKHFLEIFLRNLVWMRERVYVGAPENFVRINITNTGNQTLVHQYLLDFTSRPLQ